MSGRQVLRRPEAQGVLVGIGALLLMALVADHHAHKLEFPENLLVTSPHIGRAVPRSGIMALDLLVFWDSHWYIDIATYGYRLLPTQSNVVFFPLYPTMMRVVHTVTGLPASIAGFLISWAAYLAALALFARWIAARWDPDGTARHVVVIGVAGAALHPAGVFFQIVYPEAVFFLLTVLLLEAIAREKALLCFALAAGMVLTRPQGLFAAITVGCVDLFEIASRKRRWPRATSWAIGFGTLAALGAFMAHLAVETGDPTSFWTKRRWWDTQASPWNLVKLLVPSLSTENVVQYAVIYLCLAGAVLLWRRGERDAAVLSGLSVILPLYKGNLMDMTRYALSSVFALVPLYAAASRWRPAEGLALAVSAALFMFYLRTWLLHGWVG